MRNRRGFVVALAFTVFGLAALPAATLIQAAEPAKFTPSAFEAARKAGLPILVEVKAPWCSVCRAQKPILSELARQPKFAKLVILEVDFDSQKEVLRSLKVQAQSTLISYKGDKEVGRSTGVTIKSAIESQLAKSI